MRRRTSALTSTLALVLTMAAAGCSGDSDEPRSTDRGGSDPFSVASALAQLPASEDVTFVTVADVAAVREANDVESPDLDDPEAVADYALRMTGSDEGANAMLTPSASSRRTFSGVEHELLGFSWLDADQLASVYAPPGEFTWTSHPEPVTPADDLVDAGDGTLTPDDGEDEPGASLLVATDGDQAVVSRSSDDIAAWRSGEDGDTLADDEELSALAAALDEEGVLSAYLMTGAGERGALGLGWTADGGEPGFVVVYDAGDADAAAAAVDGLRAEYDAPELAEHLELEDVTSEGRVVVVTATPAGDRVQVLLQLLFDFSLPLAP